MFAIRMFTSPLAAPETYSDLTPALPELPGRFYPLLLPLALSFHRSCFSKDALNTRAIAWDGAAFSSSSPSPPHQGQRGNPSAPCIVHPCHTAFYATSRRVRCPAGSHQHTPRSPDADAIRRAHTAPCMHTPGHHTAATAQPALHAPPYPSNALAQRILRCRALQGFIVTGRWCVGASQAPAVAMPPYPPPGMTWKQFRARGRGSSRRRRQARGQGPLEGSIDYAHFFQSSLGFLKQHPATRPLSLLRALAARQAHRMQLGEQHPADALATNLGDIVYMIVPVYGNTSPLGYIGSTTRSARQRLGEHVAAARRGETGTAVPARMYEHLRRHGCTACACLFCSISPGPAWASPMLSGCAHSTMRRLIGSNA